jgi:Mitochondrial carrier protein
MNIDDYEALQDAKLSITLFAGACAGCAEHLFMYPVDTIKVSACKA